jgi:hypothetical protein
MWTRAIVASGLALPLVLFGVAPVRAIDGRAWKDLPEPARAYYIVGVVDAWANFKGASDFVRERRPGTPPSNAEAIYVGLATCIQDRGLNYQAILDLVDRYMTDHPGQWSTGMSGLIWNALNGFCGDK